MGFTRIGESVSTFNKVECLIDDERYCSLGGSKFQLGMSSKAVYDFNARFVAVLERAKDLSKYHLTIPYKDYKGLIKTLYKTGLACYQSLGDLFESQWKKYIDQNDELNLVVTTDTYPLLWELLYTGPYMVSVPDVELFVGMRHRITRRLPGVNEYIGAYDPPVGFLFNQHKRLKHVQEELSFLMKICENRLVFDVIDKRLDEQIEPDLSQELSDRVILAWRAEDYNFIHVASHLRQKATDSSSALNLYIEITYRDSVIEIPVIDLAAASSGYRFRQMPLVFLNACKTLGNEILLDSTSFPKVFMRLGANAVIATVCDVPDLFAMKFAQKFYELLFGANGSEPMTPGEAILSARRYFLLEHNNPLGFAYVLYSRQDFPIRWA